MSGIVWKNLDTGIVGVSTLLISVFYGQHDGALRIFRNPLFSFQNDESCVSPGQKFSISYFEPQNSHFSIFSLWFSEPAFHSESNGISKVHKRYSSWGASWGVSFCTGRSSFILIFRQQIGKLGVSRILVSTFLNQLFILNRMVYKKFETVQQTGR